MLKKAYVFSSAFFALLVFFGAYLGRMGAISTSTSIVTIAASALAATYMLHKKERAVHQKIVLSILLGLASLLIYISAPSMIIPHGAGDFQNHAQAVRLLAKNHGFGSITQEPQLYQAAASMLYSIYPYTYAINSILPLSLIVFSIIGIFLISCKFLPEKSAIVAAFVYAFSLTNIWMLEQGYFPQLLGQFFFIAGVYMLLERNNTGLMLSGIGIVSYLPYFLVYFIFLGLNYLRNKDWKAFISAIIGVMIMLPEMYTSFFGRISLINESSIPFRHTLLMQGGILTPTLLSLVIFLPVLWGANKIWKMRKQYAELLDIVVSIAVIMTLVLLAFTYVVLMGYTTDIRYLYLFGKLFYLLVFPLSILSAIGLQRSLKAVLMVLLAFHFIYTAAYIVFILPEKANLPSGFYEIAEKMDALPGEFTVGIDKEIIMNKNWKPIAFYKSLVDVPDTSYSTGGIAKAEIGRALHFWWVKKKVFIDGIPTPLNSRNESIILYNNTNVEYYITDKKLNNTIAFENHGIYAYKMT